MLFFSDCVAILDSEYTGNVSAGMIGSVELEARVGGLKLESEPDI